MKKLLLIGLGFLAFAGMGSLTKAEAGVQVSINLGGPAPYRPYHRPAPVYYYDDYPGPVVYARPYVVYSRAPVYYAPAYPHRRPVCYR